MFDYVVSRCIHKTLVRLNRSGDVEGDAAESWTISPDRTVYKFKLKLIRFHDGTALTTEIASESLNRSLTKDSDVAIILANYVKSIKPEKDKLVVILNQPFDPFLKALASVDLALFKSENGEADFSIGLGSYSFKQTEAKQAALHAISNPEKSITLLYANNVKVVEDLIKNDTPDAIFGLPNEVANKISSKIITIQNINNFTFSLYLVNSQRPIARADSMRRSVNRAIETARDDFLKGNTRSDLERMDDVLPKGILPDSQMWVRSKTVDNKWQGELRLAFPVGWWPEQFGTAILKRVRAIAPRAELVRYKGLRDLDLARVDFIQSDYILPFPDPEAAIPAYSLKFFGISENSATKHLRAELATASKMSGKKRLLAFQSGLRSFVNEGWAIPLFTSKVSILKKPDFPLGEGEYQFEGLLCH